MFRYRFNEQDSNYEILSSSGFAIMHSTTKKGAIETVTSLNGSKNW